MRSFIGNRENLEGDLEMKNTASKIVASIIVSAFGGTAAAEESRWYASASLGAGNLKSTSIVYSDGTDEARADADFSTSFTGGGTLGYRFDNGWNIEGDITYRRNEMDPVDLGAFGSTPSFQDHHPTTISGARCPWPARVLKSSYKLC